MKTEFYKVDREAPNREIIALCGKMLREGKLVCFPTETVYGLGANAFDPEAVSAVYAAKGRPADNPLIVHISDYAMLETVSDMTERERKYLLKLGEAYWPGPLTVIVTKNKRIPREVTCGLDTVGIRFPAHPVARALIEAAGVPVAAPSANSSGRPSPTLARHVAEDLDGKVSAVLDGGPCDVGLESTVIDITGDTPCILRPGAVTLEMVRKIFPDAAQLDWRKEVSPEKEPPRSPGLKYKHYAPKANVVILQGEERAVAERIRAALAFARERNINAKAMITDESQRFYSAEDAVVCLGKRADGEAQAAGLFQLLRAFDDEGVQEVYAEALPEDGVGYAVMNRLYRAAGCRMAAVKRVLFVCTGNTCRSFMAEYIFKQILRDKVEEGVLEACSVSAVSAGLCASPGQKGSDTAIEVLRREYGCDGSPHRARLLTRELAESADLILTMTRGHKSAILQVLPEMCSRVFTLAEYACGDINAADIDDPFMGSYETYSVCAGKMYNALSCIYNKLF